MLASLTSLFLGSALVAQVAVPPPRVTVGIEHREERVRYHFDNPSNFDTVDLVPHFYEQRYDAGSAWLVLTADYRVLGGHARTHAGFTPRVTTSGSDIDSFFDPGGDVITSGTAGQVRRRSFSIDQRFGMVSAGRWRVDVTIGYQRSQSIFLPADIIVTHTQPPSTSATFTTTREFTVSRVLQSGIALEADWRLPRQWRLRVSTDATPIVRARITTSLPDKYDHDIGSDAIAFGAVGRLTVERQWSNFVIGAGFSGGGAWGYRGSANYQDRLTAVTAFVRYPL